MAQPSQNDVHIDVPMTNISVAYLQTQDTFLATKVFPVVQVAKQSDKYYKYTKNDWFRDEAQRRADSTESAGSGYTLGSDSYSCDVWAFHKDVGDRVRKNCDSQINLDSDAVRFITQRILLRQEIQWVSDYFKKGVWTTDLDGGTHFKKWSDYVLSDPIEDVATAKEAMLKNTGLEINTAVLGYKVMRMLRNHPDIRDRYKYTTAGQLTEQMIASVLDLDRVFVAKSIKATNVEGAAEAYDFTHANSVWLGHVASSPGMLTPSAGYVFAWDGVSGGGLNVGVSRIRMETLKADRFEIEASWDNKVVAPDLGYFLDTAV